MASERLGHVTVSIKLDHYIHALDGLQVQAAERVGDVLFGIQAPGAT